MSAQTEKTGAGMDLLSFVFDSPSVVDTTKPAFIDGEDPTRYLNKQQTRVLTRKLIAGLKRAGLEPGDCVLLLLGNSILIPAIYFGIIGAGGVHMGANPASQGSELDHLIHLTQAKFIITSEDMLSKLSQSSEGQKFPSDHVFVLDAKNFPLSAAERYPPSPPAEAEGDSPYLKSLQWANFMDLTTCGESDWIRFNDADVAKTTPAAMFSTSGTSGPPKAAIYTHWGLVNQHLTMENIPSPDYEIVRMISLPLFHSFASLFAHVWPIRNNHTLYILPRFQPEQFLTTIERFGITDTLMAPPIVHLMNQKTSIKTRLDSIRWIGVGGAPIGVDAMDKFEAQLNPRATLTQVWGMTEVGVTTLIPYPERAHGGSIGRPLPGYEMRLLDASGNTIMDDNEAGELQVRYTGMMLGYKNKERHPEMGWYDSGDIVSRINGNYFVVGRSKEVIKVNGWQVAPAELEATLLLHPCVKDVGVVGVMREDGVSEVPRAYVVRKSGVDGKCSNLSSEEVFEFARERLASYKALKGGVVFVDEIPRNASGKIQRFKLTQMDQYRQTLTKVLAQTNTVVPEPHQELTTESKVEAPLFRTATGRNHRLSAIRKIRQTIGQYRDAKLSQPKKRFRTSLLEKMKALDAWRLTTIGRAPLALTA